MAFSMFILCGVLLGVMLAGAGGVLYWQDREKGVLAGIFVVLGILLAFGSVASFFLIVSGM